MCVGVTSTDAAVVVFTDLSPAAAPASSATEVRLSIITPQICLLRAQSSERNRVDARRYRDPLEQARIAPPR